MLDGCVYGIDLNTLSVRELVTNLSVQDFAVSASNRYFAWMETEGDSQMGSSVIHVMNLSDQSTQEIAAGTGKPSSRLASWMRILCMALPDSRIFSRTPPEM